jgi:hypothetical protein
MQRLATFAILIIGVLTSLGSPIAQAADAQPTVSRTSVGFTMTSATCSNLPAGTTINGSGTETSVTTVKTDRSGATTIQNATTAQGSATDLQGNRYQFQYTNRYTITNSTAHPDVFTGTMMDLFVLAGRGPANLRNGFDADLTDASADLSTVSYNARSSFGDPISFPSGAARCDPL